MDEDLFTSSSMAVFDPLTLIQSLHFDLSILRDKIHQVQSFIAALASADQANANTVDIAPFDGFVIHDMITVASSILLSLQQLAFGSTAAPAPQPREKYHSTNVTAASQPNHDVVEMDAGVLLAKYTHYCHVCGKGFRRDANLRMHMRAHGDAYKTREALLKGGGGGLSQQTEESGRTNRNKYSCPQEGCRWNWKHAKFQPLKSVACAKNHYKRSHCPKLYVCSRCGNKEFSVLSDLRTHEKHCGKPRWRCSCGTTFSRKDKLLGHSALFAGHVPVPEGVGLDVAAHQEELQWIF